VTWRPTGVQGRETSKTRWRAVPYLRGKGLDLGCGAEKVLDTKNVIGIDSDKDLSLFGNKANFDIQLDVTDLSMFASRSVDFVYSSHVLEHIELAKAPQVLRDWCRLIKKGGYLVLYLPLSGLYPDPGEQYANGDHKFAVTYDVIDGFMQTVPRDWDLVHWERCDKNDEYSGFWAYRLTSE
jgi:SAM-dependent methyltransferase